MTNKSRKFFPLLPFILYLFRNSTWVLKLAASRVVTPLANSKLWHRVLGYLQVMADYCRDENRKELQWYYEDALKFTRRHILGKLPEKPASPLAGWVPVSKMEMHERPDWFQEKYARPYRKIVRRITSKNGSKYELLECEHKSLVSDFYGWSQHEPAKLAKGRRCSDCSPLKVESPLKKPSRSVAAIGRKVAVALMLLIAVACHAQTAPDVSFTAEDGIDLAMVLLPLAALIVGIGIGISLTKYSYFVNYKTHLDKHFFSETPDRECSFCKEERGWHTNAGGHAI